MPNFRYTAIDSAGRAERGVLEAASEAEAVARLRQRGSLPVRAEPDTGRRGVSDLLGMEFGNPGLSRQDVADVTRELATLLGTGQDIDHALRFMVETTPRRRARVVLGRLRAAVRDGGALAAALAREPNSFSRLYVGMVRAGEAGATLAATLERMAVLLERERALVATIQTALVYPALLLVAAIGSIALLLTEVLPQFVPLFAQAGATLPRSTELLMAAGDLVRAWGLSGLLAAALALLGLRAALRRPGPRLFADRLILRAPILGGLARDVLAARFGRALGTLLLNGVPLIAALGIARDAIGNRAGMAAVERATLSAKDGAGLARPLRASGVFPPRLVHLLRLGEETARLGEMAVRAAEIHEEATRLGVQRLVALLVPAITIAMGAAIAAIVSSLLLAMLSLNDLAQ